VCTTDRTMMNMSSKLLQRLTISRLVANKTNKISLFRNRYDYNKIRFTTSTSKNMKNEKSTHEWNDNILPLLDPCKESNKKLLNEISSRLSERTRKELNKVVSSTVKTKVPIVERPSNHDLKLIVLNQVIPFIGFGLMDNGILIIAGDAIDIHLGVLLGISTLCSAALGNIISNITGIILGGFLEELCMRIGIPVPNLTVEQRKLRIVRACHQFGIIIGLTIGCLIGMFPLMFIDHDNHMQHRNEVFDTLTNEKEIMRQFLFDNNDSTLDSITLFLIDHDTLCTSNTNTGDNNMTSIPINDSSDDFYNHIMMSKKEQITSSHSNDKGSINGGIIYHVNHDDSNKIVIGVPMFNKQKNIIGIIQVILPDAKIDDDTLLLLIQNIKKLNGLVSIVLSQSDKNDDNVSLHDMILMNIQNS